MLPLIGGGETKMQPVFVGDVASAIADAVDGKTKAGATYELGGPEVLSLREIMAWILSTTDRERMLVPLPFGLAKFKAFFLQFAPGALKLTPDQVELLKSDNVVSDAAKAAGLTLRRSRHRTGFDGSGLPAISLALPPDGPVPAQERVRAAKAASNPSLPAKRYDPSRST